MRTAKKTVVALAVAAALIGFAPVATAAPTTPATTQDAPVGNGGKLGPGLSDLPGVSIAEGILAQYGITDTYAGLLDLDRGTVGSFISSLLALTGESGVVGVLNLLGGAPEDKA
jgi:hypothetical protein